MKIFRLCIFFAAVTTLAVSCKKNNLAIDQEIVPPSFVKFNTNLTSDTAATYFIRDVNNTYKLPVGVSTVSDKDRTITISYSSRTAVQGAQYTAPTSILIPAGKALDTLVIQGIFAGYPTAAKIDTLKITLGGDVPTSAYKGTYTLYMRKYCNVVINSLAGTYANTRELYGTSAYGPYTTTVSNITPISATKARISISNIWDTGWGPIEFELDWTNPANQTTTVIDKSSGIGDAGDLSAAYAGQQVAVRANATTGTFDACGPTIILRMQLGVAGVGWFGSAYTVTMLR